jgi:hypothetical protein
MYCSIPDCNNVDIMTRIVLIYSWFKLCCMPLFTICIVTCIQTSTDEVFDPKGSGSWAVY